MRKTLVLSLCGLFLIAGLMASDAGAQKFVFGKHAQDMAASDAQMAKLKAETAIVVKAAREAEDWQDKCMAPFKMVAWPLSGVGYGIVALRYRLPGVGDPSNSCLEYAAVPSVCRGANTAKNYGIQNMFGGALDLVTLLGGDRTIYAPRMNEMGVLAKRTMERGPIPQMLETGASATPVACALAEVLAPIAGTCYEGTAAILGTTVPVAATVVGEGAGMAEKKMIK